MEDEKDMKFNIYYLNFSKVYEISMMIENTIVSSMQREKADENESSEKTKASITAELGSKYLARIKAVIGAESNTKDVKSSKLIESLDVITTKSILLRDIISKCKNFSSFGKCEEGDLVKINKLTLNILDEEKLRQMIIFRKNALKGLNVDGFEVNNLISSMLQDYSYILKGSFEDSEEEILLKIPMEIENDFESQYTVDDLLIGRLSIVGVYKGKITEDFIKKNTVSYFENLEAQQQKLQSRVTPSSDNHSEESEHSESNNKEKEFHFIDIIAIIQDVQFENEK